MPQAAWAAPDLDGATLSWPWALPFAGILLTIAIGPMLFAGVWYRHYGKIAAGWSALALVPIVFHAGAGAAIDALLHALLIDYLSFIALLFALYVVAGGILVTGNLHGRPADNAGMLFVGTCLASLVGTTGAAMILIRPLIRANEHRRHNAHVFVFFIFLVANIGGALTPLGNPPAFVGFLHGVDFFWTTQRLAPATCVTAALVLAAFVAVDLWLYRREHPHVVSHHRTAATFVRIRGWINVPLIAAIIATVLVSASWAPGTAIRVGASALPLRDLVRDAILVALAVISFKLTPLEHRRGNGFSWEPIREVAMLFAGIFVCVIPVLAMLQAGPRGGFAWLLVLATRPDGTPNDIAYFWLTGALSALLDNAPTYLVFFELAGANAHDLMGPLAGTLAAITLGANYLGALTYIGNAPNFMVYAIAVERGIAMPSFFAFTARSMLVLLPVFAVVGWLFLT